MCKLPFALVRVLRDFDMPWGRERAKRERQFEDIEDTRQHEDLTAEPWPVQIGGEGLAHKCSLLVLQAWRAGEMRVRGPSSGRE